MGVSRQTGSDLRRTEWLCRRRGHVNLEGPPPQAAGRWGGPEHLTVTVAFTSLTAVLARACGGWGGRLFLFLTAEAGDRQEANRTCSEDATTQGCPHGPGHPQELGECVGLQVGPKALL